MKHYMKWMAAAIVVGAVALVNVKVVLDANRTNDLVETTLETFGQNTGGGQESNEQGSGKFFFESLTPDVKDCPLYKYVSIHGGGSFVSTDPNIDGSYTKIEVRGAENICRESGSGCTLFTCQQVP